MMKEKLKSVFKLNKTKALYLALLVLAAVFSLSSPVFLSYNNLMAILRQVTVTGVCAVGATFVLIAGGVDLSVGAMISLCGMTIGFLNVKYGVNIWICAVIAVAFCVLIGLFNGLIVAKVKLIALVVTMATAKVIEGVVYTVSGGMPIGGIDKGIRFLGQGRIWIFPVPVLILFLSMYVGYFILNKCYIGRHIYACGGSENAARLSGIHTDKVKILCYGLCGFFTGISGLIMLGRVNSAQPNTGLGDEAMNVMTAVMLGGASFMGGGSVMGTIAGVLIIGTLNNGLLLLGCNDYIQTAAKGVVLLIAICFDPLQKNIAARIRTKEYVKKHNL